MNNVKGACGRSIMATYWLIKTLLTIIMYSATVQAVTLLSKTEIIDLKLAISYFFLSLAVTIKDAMIVTNERGHSI